MGSALAILLEKRVEQRLGARLVWAVFVCGAKLVGDFLVLRRANLKGLRPSLASYAANVAAKHFGLDALLL